MTSKDLVGAAALAHMRAARRCPGDPEPAPKKGEIVGAHEAIAAGRAVVTAAAEAGAVEEKKLRESLKG